MGNRAETGQRMEQGGELVGDLLFQVLVCSNSTPTLAPVRPNESFTTHLRCALVWAAMATGSPSIARVLVLPKPPMLGGHEPAPTLPTQQLALHRLPKAVGWLWR